MKDKCIIIGAGTYGQVYAEYLKEDYEIIGFLDIDQTMFGKYILNIEILGDTDILQAMDKSIKVFVPIGKASTRIRLLKQVQEWGFDTPNFIHKTVNIDSSVLISGSAVYILQGTIIMPHTKISKGVMISSGSIISHHTTIEEGVFISFGVNVGASLVLKEKAYLGIGCTIMTGVKEVGKNALIGAGSVVIRDVPDNAVVVGNPAKELRKNADSNIHQGLIKKINVDDTLSVF